MTNEFEKKILETLKEKDITPKSKWEFLVKDSMFWSLAALTVLLGAVCVSAIAAILHSGDWDIVEKLGHSPMGYVIALLPHAWVIILVGFILLADYYVRHTKKGYTYSLLAIVAVVVIASIALGLLLFRVGVGHDVDEFLAERVPHYNQYGNKRELFLFHPESGVIAGKVIMIQGDNWNVVDKQKQNWHIETEEARIWGKQRIRVGMHVRIEGEIEDDTVEAEYIKPLRPPRHMRFREPAMAQ
ncbi:MAG: hypothetical protein HOE53_00670 [Candidatus Magasanikbacteria bacterium]|jgi:hypothetical protein|nr:hypothetical protein [Candidatus Magasanikbacteria bacterium]